MFDNHASNYLMPHITLVTYSVQYIKSHIQQEVASSKFNDNHAK